MFVYSNIQFYREKTETGNRAGNKPEYRSILGRVLLEFGQVKGLIIFEV